MKLIIKKFNVPVKEIKLEEGQEYILGREESCNILLSSENLISRKHLKISQSDNQLWKIECLSELGGLHLDGEMVDGVELDSSVTLSFHEYLFKFIDEIAEEKLKEEQVKKDQSLKAAAVEKPPVETPPEEVDPDKSTKIVTLGHLNYCLNISVNEEPAQYVDLNEGSCWIVGREEECDIVLENNYLTKRHFEILKKKEQFTIKDLGSSNGTFLNGKKLQPHVSNNLKSEDLITIGDVKIVFEARSKDFHKLTENIPVPTTTQDSPNASMALSKVLLEEESGVESVEEATALKQSPVENKKKMILYAVVGVALMGMLLFGTSNKKEEDKEVKGEEDKKMQMIENAYQFATVLMSQQKYALCVEELNNLHKLTPYYRDSQQLLVQCQTAVENQKKQDELREQEENARKVKEKVAVLVAECKKQMDTFESVEELHRCLGDALSLDPGNEEISVMQNTLEHKMEMALMKENEKREFEALVQKKRALYNRAKWLKNQGKDLKKVVAPAYRKFLASAKGFSALKGLYDKASRELQSLEQGYEDTLNQLYTNCKSFIKSSQMKKAYGECLSILNFKKQDPKAIAWVNQAKKSLRDKLKPLYVKSALEESLSNVEEAKELWKQIVKEDVETGYYYKKAKSKLANYK